jgi:hypothetical protein
VTADSHGGADADAADDATADDATADDTRRLAALLERAASTDVLPDAERQSLEQTMEQLLRTTATACAGCEPAVVYVDEVGGGDYFRCRLESGGEVMADLHLFHRPGVPAETARGWGRRTLAGHPASGLDGDHLFVWPGHFEIRAFARADGVRGEEALARLLEALPLDSLARL